MNTQHGKTVFPFFSIVVTAYNCSEYIHETLESVESQTFNGYEVIIIDDCSTDNSVKKIEEFIQNKHNWSLHINPQNQGVALSRNAGFSLAKGNFIAILDSDDIWENDKLEKQFALLKDNTIDICYSSYSYIDKDSVKQNFVYKTKNKATYKKLLNENFIGCSTSAFRAEVSKKYHMKSDMLNEDYYFWLTLLKNGCVGVGIDEPLVRYRVHNKGRSFNKLDAAKARFVIYYKLEKLSLIESSYRFAVYSINATLKFIALILSGTK